MGVLYDVLRNRGLQIEEQGVDWVSHITSGKVDYEDFEEVIAELKRL